MTWQAKFKIQEVGEGPAPIDVLAVADVANGSLIQNTENVSSMELRLVVNTDQTSLKVGDEILANGHFTS